MIGTLIDWVMGARRSAMVELSAGLNAAIPEVPDSVLSLCSELSIHLATAGPWAQLVPWWSVGVALTLWLLGFGAGVAIKLLRIKLSLFTGGGGSA